jgi:hypothetical protein
MEIQAINLNPTNYSILLAHSKCLHISRGNRLKNFNVNMNTKNDYFGIILCLWILRLCEDIDTLLIHEE